MKEKETEADKGNEVMGEKRVGGGGMERLKREEKPIFLFFSSSSWVKGYLKMNVFHLKLSFLKAPLPSIILPANEHTLIPPKHVRWKGDVHVHGARILCLPHGLFFFFLPRCFAHSTARNGTGSGAINW